MKSNKSKEMAHKIKLARGWRSERRSRRRWRRAKTGCPAASCWRHNNATRLFVQLSCCWWGRTQPWLLLWGGKRSLLAAAGSYDGGVALGLLLNREGEGCEREEKRGKRGRDWRLLWAFRVFTGFILIIAIIIIITIIIITFIYY